jgi:hypothetical protein
VARPLDYHRNDERPYWAATITIDGATEDMSAGYTFQATVATSGTATPVLTKTTGITGSAGGVVTVAWATGDLDIAVGTYEVQLTVTRTADGKDFTISDTLNIKPRLKA